MDDLGTSKKDIESGMELLAKAFQQVTAAAEQFGLAFAAVQEAEKAREAAAANVAPAPSSDMVESVAVTQNSADGVRSTLTLKKPLPAALEWRFAVADSEPKDEWKTRLPIETSFDYGTDTPHEQFFAIPDRQGHPVELRWFYNGPQAGDDAFLSQVVSVPEVPVDTADPLGHLTDISRGRISSLDWNNIVATVGAGKGGTPKLPDVELVNGALRQQYNPGSNGDYGTRRNVGFARIAPVQGCLLEFDLHLEDGWTWGGHGRNGKPGYSGKLGWGFAGGSRPAGGDGDDDGFTLRLAHKHEGELMGYCYSANRAQRWGDELRTGFTLGIGMTNRIGIGCFMNSRPGVADGSVFIKFDGRWRLLKDGVEFYGSGTPQIDSILHSAFFGGGPGMYEPARTCYSRMFNLSLTRIDPSKAGHPSEW